MVFMTAALFGLLALGSACSEDQSNRTIASQIMTDGSLPEVFVQLGHSQTINSLDVSLDQRWIVSSSVDSTIKLWDVVSGRLLRTFKGHTTGVGPVALSPDGKWIFSSGRDSTLRVWDVASGRMVRNMRHQREVTALAISPDGHWFLTGSDRGGSLDLRDVSTGNCVHALVGHDGPIYALAFSADSQWAVSAGKDSTIRIWEVATGKQVNVLRESIGATAIAFSPDARWILSGGNDGITRLWLSASQNANPERAFWGGYRKILAVRFSSDGRSILSASADGKLGVWDRSSGKKVRDIETNVNVSTLSFSSDGRLALWAEWNSGSHGNRGYRIQLKEVATGRELGVFQGIGSGEAISSIAVSRDGRWLGAQQVQDKTTQLWDCHKGCSLRKIPQHGGDTTTITFSPDSRRILLGTTNGDLRLIDTDNGKTIDNFTGHSNEITGAKFSFDGSLLLSGDSAGNVHLWDIESGQQLYSLNAKNRIRAVAFSPDGHWGLSWDSSGLLHMLPINGRTVNEQPSARLLGIIGFAVAISPDARFAVTNELGNCEMIGFDSVCNKKLALWETSTGNIIQTWEVGFVKDELLSLNAIIAADFSPDGKQIVSGSMDGTLHLLNVGDAQKATIIGIHTGGIRTVTFSANGHSILSGGHDGTIRLWQPQTGRELVEYVALNATEWVAITSHGYFNALPQGLKHINARRGTEIYGADRFSAKFHRPDIIEEVLRSGGTNEPAIADEGWKDNTTYLITGQSYGQNFKDAPVCPGRAETIVTRRWSAWLLGSGLRTAVFNNASSPIGSENGVDIPFQSVRTLAEDFHVSLPALPKSSGERVKDLANAIIYLDNASKLIEEGLSDDDTYTPDYRALFRFSSHFGLMLLMYDPHGDPDYTTTVLGIIDTLKELGEEMRLPRDLWIKPVILMEQGNPPQSVHEALAVTDRRVNEYFESLYSRSK